MASFKDKQNREWTLCLDPVSADEIKQKHQVELVNLEKDPMQLLRVDPMKLVAVVHILCQEQIQERSLTPEQFAKSLPFPPDEMLKAVEDSIVSFFPTGRHSHVREVLASYAGMGARTDELTTVKMRQVLENPLTLDAISKKADIEIQAAMTRLIGSPPGT